MRNQERNLRILRFVLLLSTSLLIAYLILQLYFRKYHFFQTNLFFESNDLFMDFFNNFAYAINRNPYEFTQANIPPLFLVFSYIGAQTLVFLCHANDFFAIRFSVYGALLYASFYTAGLFLIYRAIRWALHDTLAKSQIVGCFVLIALSYPFLFCFDRGNYVIMVSALLALFMMSFLKKNYTSAAIMLGIAAALKLYPAIFGVVFLVEKRWKEAALSILVGLSLTLLPFLVFQGGFHNVERVIERTINYSVFGNGNGIENYAYNNSLYMLFDVPFQWGKGFLAEPQSLMKLNRLVSVFSVVMLACIVWVCFIIDQEQDRFLLLTCAMLLFPFLSGDYNLTALAFPLVFWMVQSDNANPLIAICGGLVLSCKRYVSLINVGTYCSLTIQSIWNPLLLIVMVAAIVCKNRVAIGFWFKNRIANNAHGSRADSLTKS